MPSPTLFGRLRQGSSSRRGSLGGVVRRAAQQEQQPRTGPNSGGGGEAQGRDGGRGGGAAVDDDSWYLGDGGFAQRHLEDEGRIAAKKVRAWEWRGGGDGCVSPGSIALSAAGCGVGMQGGDHLNLLRFFPPVSCACDVCGLLLSSSDLVFENLGRGSVCPRDVLAVAHDELLRDSIKCLSCSRVFLLQSDASDGSAVYVSCFSPHLWLNIWLVWRYPESKRLLLLGSPPACHR